MFRQSNLDLWAETILKDEFMDGAQTNHRGEDGFHGIEVVRLLIQMAPIERPTLNVGCGCARGIAFDHLMDPSPARRPEGAVSGWVENIPLEDFSVNCILCWGTFTFIRSPVEALMEMNRVLQHGGALILDVVLSTTMPLCQTVHGPSFVNWVQLFGFRLIGVIEYGEEHHKMMGLRLEKVRDFDPAYFRMPQCLEWKVRNYLPERDWYLL